MFSINLSNNVETNNTLNIEQINASTTLNLTELACVDALAYFNAQPLTGGEARRIEKEIIASNQAMDLQFVYDELDRLRKVI